MAVSLVAAAAFHWFGVDYAAGAPVDVTGWSDRAIAQLIKNAPVVAASSGGSTQVLTAKAANYAAVHGDAVLANATTANVTVTLPAPTANASVWVKKVDGSVNTVTVAPHAAEHIDGSSSSKVITAQNAALQLNSDGTDWWVF